MCSTAIRWPRHLALFNSATQNIDKGLEWRGTSCS
jgi:hypothetical protein